MEDLEMKDALRRYAEAGEPPFPLTANALISEARRRQRWRMGLGVGASAVTTLAIVSAATLAVPPAGDSMLERGCDVQLPLGSATYWPPFGVGPSSWPTPFPSGYVVPEPGATPTSTAYSSPDPTSDPSPDPTYYPTPDPTYYPTLDPTQYPTSSPTGFSTPDPTHHPSMGLTGPPEPTAAPVERARLDEMSCFLKHRMLELLPGWRFIGPAATPPLDVTFDELTSAYRANAYVLHGPLECLISVNVWPVHLGPDPGFSHTGAETRVAVRTGSSTINVVVEGRTITDEQVMEIANAPELDLYR